MIITKQELLFFLISILYLVIGFNFNIVPSVEGISLLGAEQVINNNIPYKDFHTIYAPGVYYLNASILFISNGLLAIRTTYLVLTFFVSMLIYFLAKDYLRTKYAFVPFFISIVWQSFVPMTASSVTIALILILSAALFLFRYYDAMKAGGANLSQVVPIGICIGLLGVVRQDMASYMYGLFFWAMFWAGIADVDGKGLTLLKRAIYGFNKGVFFTVIAFITFLPFAIYFISKCGINDLYYQIIELPLTTYKLHNSQPFPNPLYFIQNINSFSNIKLYLESSWRALIFFVPLGTAIVAVIVLFIKYKKKLIKTNTPVFWKEVLIVNLCLNLFNYAVICSNTEHILPALLCAAMLLPNILTTVNRRLQPYIAFLVLFLFFSFPLFSKYELVEDILLGNYKELTSKKGKNIYVKKEDFKYYEIHSEKLSTKYKPISPKFTKYQEHNKIINNDFILFYLEDLHIPLFTYELYPYYNTR